MGWSRTSKRCLDPTQISELEWITVQCRVLFWARVRS